MVKLLVWQSYWYGKVIDMAKLLVWQSHWYGKFIGMVMARRSPYAQYWQDQKYDYVSDHCWMQCLHLFCQFYPFLNASYSVQNRHHLKHKIGITQGTIMYIET